MMNTAGHADRVRDCVLARVDDQRRALLAALHVELEAFDSSPNGSSPILFTLGQAVEAVSDEAARGLVDVVVLTDGVEFADASFYPASGRHITPAEALAKTRAVTGSLRGARVTMAGIGVTNDSMDTVGASALVDAWRAILLARGATPIQITTGPPQRLRR
jgi:hypothetical protein